jgi:hypothetical protein
MCHFCPEAPAQLGDRCPEAQPSQTFNAQKPHAVEPTRRMALATFHPFPRLPAELRREIYLLATPPRIVHIRVKSLFELIDQELNDDLSPFEAFASRLAWRDLLPMDPPPLLIRIPEPKLPSPLSLLRNPNPPYRLPRLQHHKPPPSALAPDSPVPRLPSTPLIRPAARCMENDTTARPVQLHAHPSSTTRLRRVAADAGAVRL